MSFIKPLKDWALKNLEEKVRFLGLRFVHSQFLIPKFIGNCIIGVAH